MVLEAMEIGGPPAAIERLWRYLARDDSWTKLAPALREPLQAGASSLFDVDPRSVGELRNYSAEMNDGGAMPAEGAGASPHRCGVDA